MRSNFDRICFGKCKVFWVEGPPKAFFYCLGSKIARRSHENKTWMLKVILNDFVEGMVLHERSHSQLRDLRTVASTYFWSEISVKDAVQDCSLKLFVFVVICVILHECICYEWFIEYFCFTFYVHNLYRIRTSSTCSWGHLLRFCFSIW